MNGDRARLLPAECRRQVLVGLCTAVLVVASYHLVDRPAAIWARGLDPGIVAVFRRITVFGSFKPYLAGLAALYPFLRWHQRREAAAQRALFVVAAIVVSGLTVDLLKPIVARWRPTELFAEPSHYGFAFFKLGEKHNSFPSGHATTAMAVACALSLLFPRWRALWFLAGALAATSRVVIGAHYPGDVLAGAWFGVVIPLALSRTAWFRDLLRTPASGPQRRGLAASSETARRF